MELESEQQAEGAFIDPSVCRMWITIIMISRPVGNVDGWRGREM